MRYDIGNRSEAHDWLFPGCHEPIPHSHYLGTLPKPPPPPRRPSTIPVEDSNAPTVIAFVGMVIMLIVLVIVVISVISSLQTPNV